MTRTAVTEPAGARTTPSDKGVPGLRTFRSSTFRVVLAAVLLAIGISLVGMMLLRQAGADDGQFAIDFADFHLAAERMAVGETPYAPEMLAGPTDAQGQDRYRYPPFFAQALRPLAGLSLDAAALLWFLIQAAAVYGALWIGTGIGGAHRDLERALWCGVAAAFFLPVFDTLWKGNVSGILALSSVLVALGGATAGLCAAAGALLKAIPGTLMPAAFVMDTRARWALLVTLAVAVGISILLAPGAWSDYPTVVANMLAGSTDYENNLAPAAVVSRLGSPAMATELVRVGMLGLALVAVVASMALARTAEGRRAAALLGVIALLLVPGTLWYHYLVVLLPFAAMAWPGSSPRLRWLLFGSAAAITLSLAWLPLAILGATVMAVVTLVVIRPRRVLEDGSSSSNHIGTDGPATLPT